MIADIEILDDDQARTYKLEVLFKCRQEFGGSPGYLVEILSVTLDECVCWFDKQGAEVFFQHHEREAAKRFVERKYQREIEERCLERYHASEVGA